MIQRKHISLSQEEKEIIEKAAKARGLKFSPYVRMVALDAAKGAA